MLSVIMLNVIMLSVMVPIIGALLSSGQYYKCVTDIIYDCNNSGLSNKHALCLYQHSLSLIYCFCLYNRKGNLWPVL
jgi:hypothetical protein